MFPTTASTEATVVSVGTLFVATTAGGDECCCSADIAGAVMPPNYGCGSCCIPPIIKFGLPKPVPYIILLPGPPLIIIIALCDM